MISPLAVREFVEAKVETHTWVKQATDSDLDLHFNKLNYQFVTQPYLHQKACLALGTMYDQFAFFLKMGLGKSKIVLDLMRYHKQHTAGTHRALILVPYLIHLTSWVEEARRHAPDLRVMALAGSTKERRRLLQIRDVDAFVLNYAGLVQMCLHRDRQTNGQMERIVDQDMIHWLANRITMLVGDESTAFKNHTTQTFRVLRALSFVIPRRYILTGTPFGKNPHDLWSQLFFVDHGKALGETLGLFRGVFFNTKRGRYKQFEHTFKKTRKDLLATRLGITSIHYDTKECIDIKDPTFTTIPVEWTQDGQSLYYRLLDKSPIVDDNRAEVEGLYMRLRQLCSGFFRHEETTVDLEHNPKIEALEQVVEYIEPPEKMVIFHFFIHSGELISASLNKLGVPHSRLWSGTTDKEGQLHRFIHDPDVRALVINETMGAMGLNLQVANYCLFYEVPVSPIIRAQAIRRIYGRLNRDGKHDPVFFYDFFMKGSVEEQSYHAVKQGRELLKEILEHRATFEGTGPRTVAKRRLRHGK